MTKDDYKRFLKGLAEKWLRSQRNRDSQSILNVQEMLTYDLRRIQLLTRFFKMIEVKLENAEPEEIIKNTELLEVFSKEFLEFSPVERAERALERSEILGAFESKGRVIFANITIDAIPEEDFLLLYEAGFTHEEIKMLFDTAIDVARDFQVIVYPPNHLRTMEIIRRAAQELRVLSGKKNEPEEKRKLFNGIGKILGGCVLGVGNALMATGSIIAPNPATAAGAIASVGVALPTIFSGIGDLRGE